MIHSSMHTNSRSHRGGIVWLMVLTLSAVVLSFYMMHQDYSDRSSFPTPNGAAELNSLFVGATSSAIAADAEEEARISPLLPEAHKHPPSSYPVPLSPADPQLPRALQQDSTSTREVPGDETVENEKGAHGTYGPDTIIGPIIGWHVTETSSTGYIIMLIILATVFFRVITSKLDSIFERLIPRKYHIYTLVPESAWIIVLGVIIGFFMWLAGVQNANQLLTFDDEVFFLFLIPPIILHAGYFLDQKFFFHNIWLILLYAMLGTLMSTFLIGSALWGVEPLFLSEYRYLDMLLFGSLTSAVDPVAVLAIFEELHVNETLNILVFGESVLNDAVSIVLYRLFEALRVADYEQKLAHQPFIFYILLGISKFMYVSIGGVAIGVIVGLLCALLTKFTNRVQIIEPLIVVIFGFLAYFLAESVLTSGIMSILFCGAIMARYVELNVEKKSHIVIKWTLTAVGVTAENMIFLYLGISLVVHNHVFDGFQIMFTLIFMMVFRFMLIYSIGLFDNFCLRRNQRKSDRINLSTMFVIAFGGLRGAIAFALAFIIPNTVQVPTGEVSYDEQRRALITTTLIVIIFTIFVQGSLIRPLLKLFKIRGTKQTEKQLKDDLKGEQDFLHHEEKEISQAVEKIEYLERSVAILPECFERNDFIEANTKVMRSMTQHIIKHVDNIIVDLEKMNANIRRLMELDAKDKKNSQNARDIMNWRLEKAADIRVSWRRQLDEMDISQRHRASKSVNEVIQHLRTQLFQLSKRPTRVDSDSEEELQEEAHPLSKSVQKQGRNSKNNGADNDELDSSRNRIGSDMNGKFRRRRKKAAQVNLQRNRTFDQLVKHFDPVEYEDTSFIEILHLHDMLEFGYDSYHTVTWARDDDYLFFLDRTLLLESLKSWNDYAEEMLRQEDVSHSLQMLKYLRKLIHIQIENRLNELTHLKKEAFADVVFGFGVKRAQPVANTVAKVPSVSRRIRNFLRRVDNVIQKVVVRGLHSEEQKLIFALRKIRKDEMEEVAYHDINLAYDEVVQHHGIKKLTEKTMKKEADTMDEVLLPDFLRNLHLKENPSRFIRDELNEYRKQRKRTSHMPRVSSVAWDVSSLGRPESRSVLGDEDTSSEIGGDFPFPTRSSEHHYSSGDAANRSMPMKRSGHAHENDLADANEEKTLSDASQGGAEKSGHVKWADHEGVPLTETGKKFKPSEEKTSDADSVAVLKPSAQAPIFTAPDDRGGIKVKPKLDTLPVSFEAGMDRPLHKSTDTPSASATVSSSVETPVQPPPLSGEIIAHGSLDEDSTVVSDRYAKSRENPSREEKPSTSADEEKSPAPSPVTINISAEDSERNEEEKEEANRAHPIPGDTILSEDTTEENIRTPMIKDTVEAKEEEAELKNIQRHSSQQASDGSPEKGMKLPLSAEEMFVSSSLENGVYVDSDMSTKERREQLLKDWHALSKGEKEEYYLRAEDMKRAYEEEHGKQ